jgi:hypothetical protein
MGRLEDIAERNRNPAKYRRGKFPWGIAVAAFVLLILVLMIFTDAGKSGGDEPAPAAEAPADPNAPKRVRGIGIYVEKSHDAAVGDSSNGP